MVKRHIALILIIILSGIFSATALCQTDQPPVTNKVLDAVAKYNSGETDAARLALTSIISDDPGCDAAYYYLALTDIRKNDIASAEENLRKAVALDPGNFWYRYRLASIYAATERPELAIDIYENLLRDFPKKSDIYFELVDLYVDQNEGEKALETIDEIETVFGITESIAVYRFKLLQAMGKSEDAFRSLEEYNREYSSPYVLTTLADWQMSMYNDSTALAYYDEALDIAPDYAPALLGKAETLRITRKYPDYFAVLDTFVSDPQTDPEGKSEYMMNIVHRADPKFLNSFRAQMDSVICKVNEVHPGDSSLTNLAGIWYYSTGRNSLAYEQFSRNVRIYPESLANRANLVEFLMYAGMWEELSEEGRKAFEAFPQTTSFLEMASVGDFNLERYDGVMEICDKVLEVAPKDSSSVLRAWSTKGDIYHQLGDSKKAYKAYDKALKVNPDYVYVLNNYAYYLSVEGKQLKKAYQMSSKTVEAEPDNATYLDTFGWILFLMGKPLEAKPFFKHAMLYGGKESAVIMDHYAEVLFALKEYDLAFVYWNLALQKNKDGEIEGLEERINKRKQEVRK